jgi:hypothetical protein
MKTESNRLSEKFSRTFPVLVQLYPAEWNAILDRLERAIDEGKTASKALRAVGVCKGLAEHNRVALIAVLADDRREIRQKQGSFHRPLTQVTLDQLASGKATGFFSYLPDSARPRRSSKKSKLPLTEPSKSKPPGRR